MYKDLEILLKCCSAFGIYIPQPRYASRKLKIFLTLYIMELMGILCLNCVLGILTSHLENDYIISWFVAAFVFVSQLFTHLVMMWECLAKQQEHNDFLRLLCEIEVSFKLRLRVEMGRSMIVAKLRRTVVTLAVVSITGLFVFGFNFVFFSDPGYFWWALFAILAMRLRFLQLQLYVEILANYLLSLNQKLNQVVSLKTEQAQQLLDIDYKNLESLDFLNHVKELYGSIYEAFHCLNEFAQGSMFATTASYFLDCTCHIYWSLLALDNFLPITSTISSLATIIPLGWSIFKFCQTCQLVKEECHRTSLMVSRLMVSNSWSTCLQLQRNYRSLVYDFSLQLMHQRIEVTGKRFFNFDLKCIFGICALIVTHLIILIQFTKSDANHDTFNQTRNDT